MNAPKNRDSTMVLFTFLKIMLAFVRRILRSRLLAAVGVVLIALTPARSTAQSASDSIAQAGVEAYDAGELARAESLFQESLARPLSQHDLAVASIYLGFVQWANNRFSDARASFLNALREDPSVVPNPTQHPPGRVDAYRAARRLVPIPVSIRFDSDSLRPLEGEEIRIVYAFENPPDSSRGPSTIDIQLCAIGADSCSVLFHGSEGSEAFWDGRIAGQLAQEGQCELVLQVVDDTLGSYAKELRDTVQISVAAPHGVDTLSSPPPPELLSQANVVMRTNQSRKRKRTVGGVVTTVLGAALAVGAYQFSEHAVSTTPSGSAQRTGAAVAYGTGALTATVGGVLTLTGLFGGFEEAELIGLPDNILENSRRRARHAEDVNAVRVQNQQIRESVVLRIRPTSRP